MGSPKERIKLYGEKADRFREIKNQIEEDLGYEPSNSEVIGHMMGDWRGKGTNRHH